MGGRDGGEKKRETNNLGEGEKKRRQRTIKVKDDGRIKERELLVEE